MSTWKLKSTTETFLRSVRNKKLKLREVNVGKYMKTIRITPTSTTSEQNVSFVVIPRKARRKAKRSARVSPEHGKAGVIFSWQSGDVKVHYGFPGN